MQKTQKHTSTGSVTNRWLSIIFNPVILVSVVLAATGYLAYNHHGADQNDNGENIKNITIRIKGGEYNDCSKAIDAWVENFKKFITNPPYGALDAFDIAINYEAYEFEYKELWELCPEEMEKRGFPRDIYDFELE